MTPESGSRIAHVGRSVAFVALLVAAGACGDTDGERTAPVELCVCPQQATVLAEAPPWAPVWPDRWETVSSPLSMQSAGQVGPEAGMDPKAAQASLTSSFMASGFDLLAVDEPFIYLWDSVGQLRVTLIAVEHLEIAIRIPSDVEQDYGVDTDLWTEWYWEDREEFPEIEARRDADAAAVLRELLHSG